MVLVFAELLPEPVYSYHKPLLTEVKRRFPEGVYLDIDSFSDDFLVSQVCRLAEEADKCVIYFVSDAPETPLQATLRLAEVLIRRPGKTLIILQGKHTRLERLFADRPNINFQANPEQQLLFAQLEAFLA